MGSLSNPRGRCVISTTMVFFFAVQETSRFATSSFFDFVRAYIPRFISSLPPHRMLNRVRTEQREELILTLYQNFKSSKHLVDITLILTLHRSRLPILIHHRTLVYPAQNGKFAPTQRYSVHLLVENPNRSM